MSCRAVSACCSAPSMYAALERRSAMAAVEAMVCAMAAYWRRAGGAGASVLAAAVTRSGVSSWSGSLSSWLPGADTVAAAWSVQGRCGGRELAVPPSAAGWASLSESVSGIVWGGDGCCGARSGMRNCGRSRPILLMEWGNVPPRRRGRSSGLHYWRLDTGRGGLGHGGRQYSSAEPEPAACTDRGAAGRVCIGGCRGILAGAVLADATLILIVGILIAGAAVASDRRHRCRRR